MPLYVLNRNHLFRSTKGVVSFEKGIPTWVVPSMEKDVVAIGAERVDGETPSVLDDEKVVPPTPMGDERKGMIFIAFDQLVERNDAKEFTGAGVPTVKAVERIVDFDVDRVELIEYWHEYKTTKVEAE